jgi:hypothetical protein
MPGYINSLSGNRHITQALQIERLAGSKNESAANNAI